MDWLELLRQGGDVVLALLSILGGLKVIARLTKTDWDDKLLDKLEAPLRGLLKLLGRKDS